MSGKTTKKSKQYTKEYKSEAVKLVREIGNAKASLESQAVGAK